MPAVAGSEEYDGVIARVTSLDVRVRVRVDADVDVDAFCMLRSREILFGKLKVGL